MSLSTSADVARPEPSAARVSFPAMFWHASAPAELATAQDWSDESAAWEFWTGRLADRGRATCLGGLLDTPRAALTWGGTSFDPRHDARLRLLDRVARGERRMTDALAAEFRDWARDDAPPTTIDALIESLAWAWALPSLAHGVPATDWWAAHQKLLDIANEPRAIDTRDEALAAWLTNVELGATLGCVFPEITICRELAERSEPALERLMADLFDGEGMPHSDWLPIARPILASWTRSIVAQQAALGRAASDESRQYSDFVEHSLRLTRRDGGDVWGRGAKSADMELLEAAIRRSRRDDLRRVAKGVAPKLPLARGARALASQVAPPAGTHSEWAGVAVLWGDWSSHEPRMAVDFARDRVRIELDARRGPVFRGEWSLELWIDGQAIEPDGDWESVCWESDGEVDYLELSRQYAGGARVERHMTLLKKDRAVFMADAVITEVAGDIRYRGAVELPADAGFSPAADTRDGHIEGRSRRASLLPLALEEWRSTRLGGELAATARGDGESVVGIEQQRQGAKSLFVPLWIDLDPKRLTREPTWRRLTVAQDRGILDLDDAAAYRVQIGREQWLVYRSLATRGNRTVLGHNLVHEFLIGRFTAAGIVKPIIQIE